MKEMIPESTGFDKTKNIAIQKISEDKRPEVKKETIQNNISDARWIDNQGNEVKEVFGFNENAELVNGRAAMFGFLMLILTELAFHGEPASKSIFGIG